MHMSIASFVLIFYVIYVGQQHSGVVISTVALQQGSPGSNPGQDVSVKSLHVLSLPALIFSRYSGFPHILKKHAKWGLG